MVKRTVPYRYVLFEDDQEGSLKLEPFEISGSIVLICDMKGYVGKDEYRDLSIHLGAKETLEKLRRWCQYTLDEIDRREREGQ